ncbi:MAG: signal peptidase II [Actinomycetota bacterium]|nr:signal peptidase II [Actinomycetota bacterium]
MQDEAGESLISQSSAHHEPPPAPARRRKGRLVGLLTAAALVTYATDQSSKVWAVAALTDAPPRRLVGSVLQLELIRNPGAAFSLGTGSTWLLTVIAAIVLVVVIRTSRRIGSVGWAWALGLLLGGALGNLTDRMVREPGVGRGHVVDFIDYNGWFIGNVADIAIVGAAILIALLALLGVNVDGTRERTTPRHATDASSPAENDV